MGYNLLNGAKEVRLFGETIEVKAKIAKMPGFSAHADKGQLLQWVGSFGKKPKRIFVVHGEDTVTDTFAQAVHDEHGLDAVAPYSGDVYDLIANTCVEEGSRVKLTSPKKEPRVQSASDRLHHSGERLMAIIRKSEGKANKDLGKFADQINSLSDKWDR
jgi:metallo-beta-lactamase family protein